MTYNVIPFSADERTDDIFGIYPQNLPKSFEVTRLLPLDEIRIRGKDNGYSFTTNDLAIQRENLEVILALGFGRPIYVETNNIITYPLVINLNGENTTLYFRLSRHGKVEVSAEGFNISSLIGQTLADEEELSQDHISQINRIFNGYKLEVNEDDSSYGPSVSFFILNPATGERLFSSLPEAYQ